MDTDKQASVDIGDLTLKVYQGDITEASVDVIVNGTNRDLDLTRGNCIYIYFNFKGIKLLSVVNFFISDILSVFKQLNCNIFNQHSG